MDDLPTIEPAGIDSSAFIPVPLRARRDGWTGARQRAFIAALAASGSVGAAARAVGMARESAYRLRRRPGAAAFAAAWDAALVRRPRGTTHPALLWHRIKYGIRTPIVAGGKIVGEHVRPDNAALLKLMARFDRLTDRLPDGGRSQ